VNARKAQQEKIKQLMKEQEITIQHRTNYFILFHMPLSILIKKRRIKMTENTQVANFNTQLSYYTNRYVDLMERDLTSRGMEFDSYSKDCVVAAMGSIFQMVHESGVSFEAINGSNLKFILSKVAALKLNANAQPRECYFQIRNVNIAAKGQKPQWEKKIEFAIEGDGNDALVSRYGVDVAKVFPYWKVREGDKYIPPRHKGVEITPPEWEESGVGKVVRIVYPIQYKDGHIEYLSCERADVLKNLAAHIKNNLQNETFGICADRYKATDAQKAQIEAKKKEIMKKVSDIGELEAIIDCEELRPYISPSYYETQSRESMIIRKMRNNIMKSIPKKWDNPVQAYEYNMMDATYREVQEEIKQNANVEEFIPQPEAIEEKPKQPTVAETVKTEEKEPIPAAEPVETEIPSFMSQEEM
jgi:hypothetical protein